MRNYSQEQKDRLMKMFSTMLDEGQDDIIWTEVTMDWDCDAVNDDSQFPPYYLPIKTSRYRIKIVVEEDENR